MQYSIVEKMMWQMLIKDIKKEIKTVYSVKKVNQTVMQAKKIYAEIIRRTPSIGGIKNSMTMILVASIILVAVYLALDKDIELDKMEKIYHTACEKNLLFRQYIKNERNCFTEKYQNRVALKAQQSKNTPYDWDWKFDHYRYKAGEAYGTDFYTSGIYKLMAAEKVQELTVIMCNLDYVIARNADIVLTREHTLANGDSCCDFRYSQK